MLGRFLLWSAAIICLLLVGVIITAPWILRYGVPEVFARYGLQASVQGGRVNLLQRELSLEAFKLGAADAPALSLAELGIGFDVAALVRGQFKLSRVRVEGVDFDPERLTSLKLPDATTRAADASSLDGGLPVDVGELSFEDLRLAFLGDRIGHEVLIRRATFRRLDALGGSEKARLALEARVANGPVKLVAELGYQADEISLTGDYRLEGVPLVGWARLVDDEEDPLQGGKLHGLGELRVEYDRRAEALDVVLDGRLNWAGVELAVEPVHASDGDLIYQGRLALSWPRLAGAPGMRGDGTLEAQGVALDIGTTADRDQHVSIGDLSWHGSFEWHEGVSVDGAILGTVLEVSNASPKTAAWRTRADDFSWRMTAVYLPGQETLGVKVEDFDLARAALSSGNGNQSLDATLEQVSIDELRAAHTGDFVIGQVSVDNVTLEQGGGAATADGSTQVINELLGEGISGGFPGKLQVARLSASSVDHDDATHSVRLEEIGFASAGFTAPGQIGSDELSVKSTRVMAEKNDIWLSDFSAAKLHGDTTGRFGAERANVAHLQQSSSGPGYWEASDLTLNGVQGALDHAVNLSKVALTSLVQSGEDVHWEGAGLHATDLSLSMGGTATAKGLGFASLERRQAYGNEIGVSRLEARGLRTGVGTAELQAVTAAAITLRFPEGDRFETHELSAGGLRAEYDSGFRADQVSVATGTGVAVDGSRHRAEGLDAREVSVDLDGAVAIGQTQVASFTHFEPDAWQLALEALRAADLRWAPGGKLSVHATGAERIAFSQSDAGGWRLGGFDGGSLAWDGRERLAAARLKLASLSHVEGSSTILRGSDLQASSFQLDFPGTLRIDALTAGSLQDGADSPAWQVLAIDASGVQSSPEIGHRIDSLRTDGLTFTDEASDAVVSVEGTEIQAFQANQEQELTARQLAVHDLDLKSRRPDWPSRLSVAELEISEPSLGFGGLLDLGDVRARDLSLVAGQDVDNTWILPPVPTGGGEGYDDGGGTDGGIRIGSLSIAGRSRIELFDRATEPEFNFVLDPLVVVLQDLDTSVPGGTATLRARATHLGYTGVAVKGELTKRVQGFDFDLTASLSGLDLRAANPYLARDEGVQAAAGRGDGWFDLAMEDGYLHGNVKLLLSGLRLERANPRLRRSPVRPADLSLQVVMALLRDEHGNIELAFPIDTRADTGEFDYVDHIGASAARTARTAANVVASLPGRAWQGTTRLAGEAASLLPSAGSRSYDPVPFTAGNSTLTAVPMIYLDQLGRRLGDDESFEISPCGWSVGADAAAVAIDPSAVDRLFEQASGNIYPGYREDPQAQLALAADRAETVRGYLQDVHDVPTSQLPPCDARLDQHSDALPRVDIQVLNPGERRRLFGILP